MRTLCTITATIIIMVANSLNAQRFSAGLFLGGSNYQGDLVAKEVDLGETNFAFGALTRYYLTNKLALRASFYSGKISGSDAGGRNASRGLSFKTSIFEGSMVAEWDLLGKARFDTKGGFTKTFTPYILGGVGMVTFKPQVVGQPDNSLDKNADYGSIAFAIPLGGGIKYDLNRNLTLGVEASTHLPFSDYLDGVSKDANPGNHDWYSWGGFTVTYWFSAPKSSANTGDGKTGAKFY